MFSIKCQEIVDPNTGVHLAFGDHGKDKSTVWVRISARVNGVDKITSVTLHRDGDVINIAPGAAKSPEPVEAQKPAEQKPHFAPPKTEAINVTPPKPVGAPVTPPSRPMGTTPPPADTAPVKPVGVPETPPRPMVATPIPPVAPPSTSVQGGLPPKP